MSLQDEFNPLFDAMPDSLPRDLTFMEIAGYSHYENIASNILKFFLNPKAPHKLGDILLKSLLQVMKKNEFPFTNSDNLIVQREVVTKNGRIDLILSTDKWVMAIENKIRHILNNDLEDYSSYLDINFEQHLKLKIVLSIKTEKENLRAGFTNITYDELIQQTQENLLKVEISKSDRYYIFFENFLQTIQNFYTPIIMEKEELRFLIDNRTKIDDIIELDRKFKLYLNQRLNLLLEKIQVGSEYKKENWEGWHIVFFFDKEGISVVVCNANNTVKSTELNRLNLFKNKKAEDYEFGYDNSRLILEKGIPFLLEDSKLIEKIKSYLTDFKITEPKTHEQPHQHH